MRMKKIDFEPDVCPCCTQTTTYLLPIDKGSAVILKKIARAIEKKGINCIHLAKEKVLNHSELCNIIRPRFHGLVAHVRGEGMQGNFLLTRKGAKFLRGERIPKYAIVSKAEGHQIGYFEAEKYTVSIDDITPKGEYWEGINYEISEGNVIQSETVTQPSLL